MGAVRNAALTSIRLAGALLLVVVLAAGLNAPERASAATFSAGDPVVTTDTVNVRTKPDTSAPIREVAVAGRPFTIGRIGPKQADGFTWYRVSTTTRVNFGWIASDFLEYDEPFSTGECVRVVDGPINLRAKAGTSGSIVTVVAQDAGGKVLAADPVKANGYLWYRITFLNSTGWAASAFLGSSNCGSTDQPFIAIGVTVRVFDGPLNAREDADLSADIVRVLPDEAVGVITDGPVNADGYVWWEFRNLGGLNGWVVDDFIVADPDADVGDGENLDLEVGDDFTVNTDALNVRATAGLDGSIIDVAAFGALGSRVTGGLQTVDGFGWVRVSIPNVGTGWVVVDFVTET